MLHENRLSWSGSYGKQSKLAGIKKSLNRPQVNISYVGSAVKASNVTRDQFCSNKANLEPKTFIIPTKARFSSAKRQCSSKTSSLGGAEILKDAGFEIGLTD